MQQRICELEVEVETLRSSLAAQQLLGDLRTSIGGSASSHSQMVEGNLAPEIQVSARLAAPRIECCVHA
jgi:hypothetical protein